jgi:hypothetical protein
MGLQGRFRVFWLAGCAVATAAECSWHHRLGYWCRQLAPLRTLTFLKKIFSVKLELHVRVLRRLNGQAHPQHHMLIVTCFT